ncbi:MAG: trypsin-like serine protease, partial [Myxococcota bacterium]|nr:trypsin-like serine protease [Myxococcota bacterium]
WNTYDLTLVELSEPAIAQPAPIARSCALEHLKDGATVELVGFGATDVWGTIATHVLMEARTTITDADCSRTDAGCHSRIQPGGEFIAGGDGVDTCTGDSGGPAFLWTPWGEAVLAGLTSRASSPAETPCGQGGIYVRADAIADWVEATSGVPLRDPDCDADPITVREPNSQPHTWQDTSLDTGVEAVSPAEPVGGCGCTTQRKSTPLQWWPIVVCLLASVRFRPSLS